MPSITKRHLAIQNSEKSVVDSVAFLITIKKTYHFDGLVDATALTICLVMMRTNLREHKPNSFKHRGCAMRVQVRATATYLESRGFKVGPSGLLILISLTTSRGHR